MKTEATQRVLIRNRDAGRGSQLLSRRVHKAMRNYLMDGSINGSYVTNIKIEITYIAKANKAFGDKEGKR